jgi:hypothetical protein
MFMAFPMRAFSLERLTMAIRGVEAIEFSYEAIEVGLKQFIKVKVIRKRRTQGNTFYELNFA